MMSQEKSGLLEALTAKQAESGRVESLCKVGLAFGRLSESDADGLRMALEQDSGFDSTAISRVLNDRGFDVSDSTVGRHRRKGCPCYKKETK